MPMVFPMMPIIYFFKNAPAWRNPMQALKNVVILYFRHPKQKESDFFYNIFSQKRGFLGANRVELTSHLRLF